MQHLEARGSFNRGIRYHPSVTLDEVMALAIWMTWKCEVVGISYDGAKGRVCYNLKEMARNELERLTRRYTSLLLDYIEPYRDVPAPVVYTYKQTMVWVMDTYS